MTATVPCGHLLRQRAAFHEHYLGQLAPATQAAGRARGLAAVRASLYAAAVLLGARAGLAGDEAADLVQEVLVVLVKKMPEFAYDPDRSFRGWLRKIALNKWRERCRHSDAASGRGRA